MANLLNRVPENAPGEFFVDSTCIDCDACRQLAPETFEDAGEHSCVYAQPHTPEQRRNALRALLACPTGSIGTEHANTAKEVMTRRNTCRTWSEGLKRWEASAISF